MGRSGAKGSNGRGACGKGKDKSESYVHCSACRYRWNFKSNHWCYQCCTPLVPHPSPDKKPIGQWSVGPPVLADAVAPSAQVAAAKPKGGGGFERRPPWVKAGMGFSSDGPSSALNSSWDASWEAVSPVSPDPLELLRAEMGDCAELEALLAKRAEAKAQVPAAEAAPRRAPLLEEEVSSKGVACRRAQAWLETCAARVVEGENWLSAAIVDEDNAMAAAYQAQAEWEAACKKQLPSPPLEGEEIQAKTSTTSAINLSTLVDEGTLHIIDGPLFDMGGLDIDISDKDEWIRIKSELAASVQEKVQAALGPAAEQIGKLREEAKKLHARMQVKRRRGIDGEATQAGGTATAAGSGAASHAGPAGPVDGTGVPVRDSNGPETLRAAARAKAVQAAEARAKLAAEAAEQQQL